MTRFNDTFALRSGWKEFVRANQIDNNDLLVFTYKGNSSFKVIIFDRSGCQKATPFFAKKESYQAHNSLIGEVKKEIISLSSDSSDTNESFCKISTRAARARTAGMRVCGKRKRRDFVQASRENESESERDEGEHGTVRKRKAKKNGDKRSSRLYVVSLRPRLTKAQEEIANRMARRTQKGSELFVKILTPNNSHTHGHCVLFCVQSSSKQEEEDYSITCQFRYEKQKCIANYSKK